ncbi:MAG: hypothetical protein PHH08_04725 [Candidatus ainarchaeum sp.]|nr:hypothetical protein [Candidatus ainarchaeum sp.]
MPEKKRGKRAMHTMPKARIAGQRPLLQKRLLANMRRTMARNRTRFAKDPVFEEIGRRIGQLSGERADFAQQILRLLKKAERQILLGQMDKFSYYKWADTLRVKFNRLGPDSPYLKYRLKRK